MSKELLFSVIIPVYNMQPYLERCLDSIVNQSYKNLEIIIVNDGSVDESLNIMKRYAQSDDRIIIIDKLNEGIGGAYMDALEIMKGDYISFVDGDDFIELNTYEILLQQINNNKNVDIIQFGYQSFNDKDVILSSVSFNDEYIKGNVNVENYYYTKIPHPSIGLKIMKRELFNDIKLLRQNVGIDVLISLQVFMKAETMLLIKNKFYHILIREQSVSRSQYDIKKVKQLENLRKLLFEIVISRKKSLHYVLPTLINETIIISCFYYKEKDYITFNRLLSEYRTHFKMLYNFLKLCKWKVQFKAILFRSFPRIYCKFH
ncbi:glycosyltransferase family 2 protein [Chryseobacterium gregarium]|uniref:glycosyltransferase family 2 protein n=1 Tax=Chryseobacterium gregarium TaxID=456299 RepID=UPI00040B35AF|nr:glycosyltransferase family 2 protein [Chryseobacterium gregarium]